MSLVEYSSSDSDAKDDDNAAPLAWPSTGSIKKCKRGGAASAASSSSPTLPPLPESFRDLYATNARPSTHDDPRLHGGRKRSMPHVEGNWPSHVYLDQAEIRSLLNPLLSAVSSSSRAANLHTLLASDFTTPQPLHISLSTTLRLATDQRELFATALANAVCESPAVKPFAVRFTGLKWAANEARNRWFLVLAVAKPEGNELNRLLAATNRVAARFSLPRLYDDGTKDKSTGKRKARRDVARGAQRQPETDWTDKFHFSLGWTLDAPEPLTLEDGGPVAEEALDKVLRMAVRFDTVKAKIGNEIKSISLASNAAETTGILG